MLGTAALIITLSVLDGFEHEIKTKVVEFTSHIEVQGYQNLPLRDYRQSIEKVKKEIPGITMIAPFAAREGMIRSRTTVDGVFLKGIDLQENNLFSRNHLVAGRLMDSASQIVIGKKLAVRLNVQIGDKIVVFALPRGTMQGFQPKAMQFQLVGIYESGMAEFDDIYAYTNLSDAQRLFQLGNAVTGYDVLVSDLNHVDDIAERIQDTLGYPHYARTVFQTYRNLFSWVELQKKLSPLLLSLIILVATVNIIGTMLMFVLEKAKAIADFEITWCWTEINPENFRNGRINYRCHWHFARQCVGVCVVLDSNDIQCSFSAFRYLLHELRSDTFANAEFYRCNDCCFCVMFFGDIDSRAGGRTASSHHNIPVWITCFHRSKHLLPGATS